MSSAFTEIVVFQNQPSHSKVTVNKEKVSNFSSKHTAHWLTHRLVVAVVYQQTVKKVANPPIMSSLCVF